MNYRLALFSAIEGGSTFWTNEISQKGVVQVYEELVGDFYHGNRNSAEKISAKLKSVKSEELSEEILKAGGLFLSPEDESWPQSLNDLVAPPIGIITTADLMQCSSVAIVGTRNPTSYGARVASEFAAGFADREWSIISGGAYGIDTSAHKGALAAEGRTIAVLASGISVNYPAGNERLFAEIRESGALISEVMPNVKARPERFLTRNRIIAALSRGTLVVEAAFRSGSLRTAREAASLYRTVMAIPGPITSPTSDGCHRLIQERCAEIVTSPADAIELMNPLTGTLSLNGA
jgi:DNA processing protein